MHKISIFFLKNFSKAALFFGVLAVFSSVVEAERLPDWPDIFNPLLVPNLNVKIKTDHYQAIVADETFKIEVPALLWASQDSGEDGSVLVSIRRKSGAAINGKINYKIDINNYAGQGQRTVGKWHDLEKLVLTNGSTRDLITEGLAWNLHGLAAEFGIYPTWYRPGLANWATLTIHLAPDCGDPCTSPFEFGITESVVSGGLYLHLEQVDKRYLKNRQLWNTDRTWLYWQARHGGPQTVLTGCGSKTSLSPAVKALQCSPIVAAIEDSPVVLDHTCEASDFEASVDMEVLLAAGAINGFSANTEGLFNHRGNFFWVDTAVGSKDETCEVLGAKRLYIPWDMSDAIGSADLDVYELAKGRDGRGLLDQIVRPAAESGNDFFGGLRRQFNQNLLDLTDAGFVDAARSFLDDIGAVLRPFLLNDPASKIGRNPTERLTELRSWLRRRAANVHMQVCEKNPTLCEAVQPVQRAGRVPDVATHLYALRKNTIKLEPFRGRGGAIEPLGNDLLFVTPKGRMGVIAASGEVTYADVAVPLNESGLNVDPIARNPRFNSNSFRVTDLLIRPVGDDEYQMFISHHHYEDGCIALRVSSGILRSNRQELSLKGGWTTIYTTRPCMPFNENGEAFKGIQAGGRMVFDGPDHLLLVVGDHEWDGRRGRPKASMDPTLDLGKLLRIDVNERSMEIVSIGLRNPQGMTRDDDGNVWASEHGPQGGDELNLLRPGANYGWPEVTYGILYGNKAWPFNPTQGRHDGYTKPIYSWIPSIAPTSMIFVDSPQFALWRGDLLIGSLRARSIFRARIDNERVIYVEKIEIGTRIRDVVETNDGRIALLSDSSKVVFLSRSDEYCSNLFIDNIYQLDCGEAVLSKTGPETTMSDVSATQNVPKRDVERTAAMTGEFDGRLLFRQMCSDCHNLFAEHGLGPHLMGVMGRQAGSVPGYGFSPGLTTANIVWNPDLLVQYIINPAQLVPDGRMPPIEISKEEARIVVEYLGSASDGASAGQSLR